MKGVRILWTWLVFAIWALSQSMLHPRTRLRYYYCSECGVRVVPYVGACPRCGDSLGNSPTPVSQSPIPWWGSIAVMMIGIVCWCVGATADISGLDEAGRALVYVPLGNLFGLSIKA
jgi:hypothetical protein